MTLLTVSLFFCFVSLQVKGYSQNGLKFSESLGIALISTEDEQRLSKFIAARPGFSFPLIVDADQSISKIFQPPSFPYIVVLNEKNEIIAVTDAG